jgi:uncharacterized protein (DUF2141 family)
MKGIYLACLLSILFPLAAISQTNSLTVKFEGMRSNKGYILVGLFNKAEGYGVRKYVYRGGKVAANAADFIYTFNDLPAGDYALSSYHDENDDGRINLNLVGFPKEDYGFSNNVYGSFGNIPPFEKAKVTLAVGQHKQITIVLE